MIDCIFVFVKVKIQIYIRELAQMDCVPNFGLYSRKCSIKRDPDTEKFKCIGQHCIFTFMKTKMQSIMN